MKSITTFKSVTALAALLALGACGNMPPPANSGYSSSYPQSSNYPQSTDPGGVYSGYGVVQSIELVRIDNAGIGGSGIGAGTIAGAVVGGILGHQIGGGSGNTAATVLGAAGGAYAGNQMEKRNQQTSDGYRLNVRMQNGSYQVITQTTSDEIRVGDRVLIENGVARRY